MRRVSTALIAALLLPATAPLLLGTAISTGALLVIQAPAQAQSAEAVAKTAQAITVRIEGATQGSGVLVKREGNRYTVLTAWHVVSGQKPGEELEIYTFDGKRHSLEESSIARIRQTDTALLNFVSPIVYAVPALAKRLAAAEPIYVAGYPLDSPLRLKIATARIIGNTECNSQVGYGGLLYSIAEAGNAESSKQGQSLRYESSHKVILRPETDIRSGVSGGPIFAGDGSLIGHHNGAVTGTNDWDVDVKMGLNRGSLTPMYKPKIEGYINSHAVCDVINAYSAWRQGLHSDAANYSLSAYKEDPKSLPFVSHPLSFLLLKLGRFNELCELHSKGAKLNSYKNSLDYMCKASIPGLYKPK